MVERTKLDYKPTGSVSPGGDFRKCPVSVSPLPIGWAAGLVAYGFYALIELSLLSRVANPQECKVAVHE
ncbi:MAG: hypothetical protein ACXWNC_08225 [Anaerolineales bacterium]